MPNRDPASLEAGHTDAADSKTPATLEFLHARAETRAHKLPQDLATAKSAALAGMQPHMYRKTLVLGAQDTHLDHEPHGWHSQDFLTTL